MIPNPRLTEVWLQQNIYNQRIKSTINKDDINWMIDYILGTISELSELLKEMRWKEHRNNHPQEFGPNVPEELADVTKYVFSMWQLMGYSSQDMLYFMHTKGLVLDQIYQQEHMIHPRDQKILILDLDGVVADFRKGFSQWLMTNSWSDLLMSRGENFGLHMDISNDWDYSTYEKAKLEFENLGGYNFLPPISSVVQAVIELRRQGYMIIAWTARPHNTYKRIWSDTWLWLQAHDIHVDALYFGNDDRVLNACILKMHNEVIALEDNPLLVQRYAVSQIPVVVIPQLYNDDLLASPFVIRLPYDEDPEDIVKWINILSDDIYKKEQKPNE